GIRVPCTPRSRMRSSPIFCVQRPLRSAPYFGTFPNSLGRRHPLFLAHPRVHSFLGLAPLSAGSILQDLRIPPALGVQSPPRRDCEPCVQKTTSGQALIKFRDSPEKVLDFRIERVTITPVFSQTYGRTRQRHRVQNTGIVQLAPNMPALGGRC